MLWSESPVAYFGTYPSDSCQHWEPWDNWNYQPGDTIVVAGMSNQPNARLLLNGKMVGEMQHASDDSGLFFWKIPFKPGTLKMEAFDNSGAITASHIAETSGLPYALTENLLTPFLPMKTKWQSWR